jgi:DNA-binding NtrC family response regulator
MDRQAVQERFGIVGTSPALQHVIDRARQVARTDITVLIEGESGVGKELVAHAIHEMSGRRHGPMKIINTGAIPEGLIESELFGAEKGAYTGASEKRTGLFEDADGGTVFLDEIGEMPLAAQVRLLRVLEDGTFSRVGSSTLRKTDVRVLAATNKNLGREVETGRFREDLYYRLSTVLIKIPPLRERPEDLLPIFKTFLHQLAQKYGSAPGKLDESAVHLLQRYRWPGNVREVRNVAEQVVVLHRGAVVTDDDIRPFLRGVTASGAPGVALLPVARPGGERDEARERELIYRVMLEMRLELRELKEQVAKMAASLSRAAPREVFDPGDHPAERRDILILRETDEVDYNSFIEDVAYEIEGDDAPPTNGRRAEGPPAETPPAREPALPTLADAEHDLITRALKHFDGNRRQTAKALGISERTLYRKLKELDEDL